MKCIQFFKIYLCLFLSFGVLSAEDIKGKTVVFKSLDGLTVTADLYAPHKDKNTPFIVLFHQADWSRGEYSEIAPKLNKLGFNCLAIDLRAGGSVNDVQNETVKRAEKEEKEMTYIHAKLDVEAALVQARTHYGKGKIIAWGSSYSAALVLVVCGENPHLTDGVLAFAPGEYFEELGKSGTWVKEAARKIAVPVFITSARSERKNWIKIFEAIKNTEKVSFIPDTKGNHGSRALWEKFSDSPEYWQAVIPFLKKFIDS